MVICLERGADMHMAQLMPLPLTVSCFIKIQIGCLLLVLAHPGRPRQRAVNAHAHTDERLEQVVTAALLHRTADDVEQVPITVTIAGAQVTLGAEDAVRSFTLTCTRLNTHTHNDSHRKIKYILHPAHQLLDFMVQGKITEADALTICLAATQPGLPVPQNIQNIHTFWTQITNSVATTNIYHPATIMTNALSAATLPINPGLGQAPSNTGLHMRRPGWSFVTQFCKKN